MTPELKLKLKLERAYSDMIFKHEHLQEYVNYKVEDEDRNWALHDRVIESMTSLDLSFVPDDFIKPDGLSKENRENAARIYQYFIQWMFTSLRISRFFSYVFFRQSEMCFAWLSIFAERLKLMTFVYYIFREVKPVQEFDPFHPINSELPFYVKENRQRSAESMVYIAAQQAYIERRLFQVLAKFVPVSQSGLVEQFARIDKHYASQSQFFNESMVKYFSLRPDLAQNFDGHKLPFLHYLESFAEGNKLFTVLEEFQPGILNLWRCEWESLCESYKIPVSRRELSSVRDLRLTPAEQKVYAVAATSHLTSYRQNVQQIIDEHGTQNDALLQESLRKMSSHQTYRDQFNTGIYEYYMFEQGKIQWQLQDVREYMQGITDLNVTDRDFELFDIIKEIGYCEAATYTIGFSNMMHLGTAHPFVLWNVQQCHEELKHFHVIRWVLNHYGVQTADLDEHYLAVANVEPTADFFNNQYDTVMINFLGETHNIRAYLMLADSLESQAFKKVMRWIAEDEVVHKKVFGAHFNYMRSKDPKWERECFESLMDKGLHMHQAKVSPHYYKLMKKIGMFYSKANRTSALKFLNMSMRAQYLELKALFSEDVFTVSEFDFRKKHLAAYAFDP